jgi:hypothetical protein
MQIMAHQDMNLSLLDTFKNPSLIDLKVIYLYLRLLGAKPWQATWARLGLDDL